MGIAGPKEKGNSEEMNTKPDTFKRRHSLMNLLKHKGVSLSNRTSIKAIDVKTNNPKGDTIMSAGVPHSDRLGARSRSKSVCFPTAKETNVAVRDIDENTGLKSINQYLILENIGYGCHGKVKLCFDIVLGRQCALKIICKSPGRDFMSRFSAYNPNRTQRVNHHLVNIRREIAIMKACNHPNIIKLYEVIDDPDEKKIYLFLEYSEKGEVKWQSETNPPKPLISEIKAREIFRDLLCGVEYLHYNGIVHRDIKPANLLWTIDGRIKITDFSVSVMTWPVMSTEYKPGISVSNIKKDLNTLVGSPAFLGPELCEKEAVDSSINSSKDFKSSPNLRDLEKSRDRRKTIQTVYELKKVSNGVILLEEVDKKFRFISVPCFGDVIENMQQYQSLTDAINLDIWAIGVTLYCLIFGRLPFYGETRFELFKAIKTSKLHFPEDVNVSKSAKELLSRLIEKNPARRIPIKKAKHSKWTTEDLTEQEAQNWIASTDPVSTYGEPVSAEPQDIGNALTKIFAKMFHKMRNFSSSLTPSMKSGDRIQK